MAKDIFSDSTDGYFCVSTAFFSNKRKGRLQRLIGERANFVPPMLWAHAALNRRNGRFPDYDYQDFQLVFNTSGLNLNLRQTKKIVDALKKTGFIHRNGTLHEFHRYNRFFSKARYRKAAFAKWRKKRAAERAAQAQVQAKTNGGDPVKSKPSQELWLLDEAIKLASGPDKKKLLKQRRELLGKATGANLTEPKSPAARPSNDGPRQTEAQIERGNLVLARSTLKDIPDNLTEPMVLRLYEAGDYLPAAVKKKFASVLEHRGEARNPVPG